MIGVGVGSQKVAADDAARAEDHLDSPRRDFSARRLSVREQIAKVLVIAPLKLTDFHNGNFMTDGRFWESTMIFRSNILFSLREERSTVKLPGAMTSKKKRDPLLNKLLEPLARDGIDISKIDLGGIQLDRESALALQREVRIMVMRGQHTTVDLDGQSIPLSPAEISRVLREILVPPDNQKGKE